MTKKEVIDVLKGLINVLEIEIIAPPLEPAFNALKEIGNMFPNWKKEKDERVLALKIVVEILEKMSEQRFSSRGKKCQLN